MSYILIIPSILTSNLTPNPVSANTSYLIAVTVTETELILEPILRHCGTIICGEEEIA